MTLRASPMGVLIIWIAVHFIGGCIVGYLEDNGAQFVATLFLSGAIIGSLQWLVLKWIGSRGRRWYLWPLVSVVGWVAGIAVSILVFSDITSTLADGLRQQFGLWEVFWLNILDQPLWVTVMALAQGSILGFAQRSPLKILGVWLLASWVGASLNGAVGAALCKAYCQPLPSSLIGVVAGSGWAMYGLVTGVALLWLLQRNRSNFRHDRVLSR